MTCCKNIRNCYPPLWDVRQYGASGEQSKAVHKQSRAKFAITCRPIKARDEKRVCPRHVPKKESEPPRRPLARLSTPRSRRRVELL